MLEMTPARVTPTHLHLEFRGTTHKSEAGHVEALKSIAKALPTFRFLRYSDPSSFYVTIYNPALGLNLACTSFAQSNSWGWKAFPWAISSFKDLQTLGLDFKGCDASHGRLRSHIHVFACLCMASCPTVHCVAITSKQMGWDNCILPHTSFARAPDFDSNQHGGTCN